MIQVSFAFHWRPSKWQIQASGIKLWRNNWVVWLALGFIELTLELEV
jgi:hypothetical protein